MKKLVTTTLLIGIGMTTACARTPSVAQESSPRADALVAPTAQGLSPGHATADMPRVIVHKSPSCGCCGLWVEHLREAGFAVDVRNEENLHPIKERLGVPFGKGSCHTAEVGGYVVEGHVPVSDIKRLLQERPVARGLVLPGMPIGSPGMEVPDGHVERYAVELVMDDGSTRIYASHGL